mmetsp:Transcript_5634/g.19708  ORF Transcript_5634/g.19708 Transcript_5634/m.19708 type:complete len:118 (-) Transcript_5634:1334-1687(-)
MPLIRHAMEADAFTEIHKVTGKIATGWKLHVYSASRIRVLCAGSMASSRGMAMGTNFQIKNFIRQAYLLPCGNLNPLVTSLAWPVGCSGLLALRDRYYPLVVCRWASNLWPPRGKKQ